MIQRNRGERPRWWSLDYWVNPDAQKPSFGGEPAVRLELATISSACSKPRRDRGHLDLATDWASDKTSQALTSDFKEGAGDFDVAFVVDEPDSGVVLVIVESGHYDLLSLDGADDLFHDDVVFRTSTTNRPLVLEAGSVIVREGDPVGKVITIESQTILACSADLPDWNAYQVGRGVLDEHFRELAWGGSRRAGPAIGPGQRVRLPDPCRAPACCYRRGVTAEVFPWNVPQRHGYCPADWMSSHTANEKWASGSPLW